MATSGSTNFILTTSDILTLALKRANVVGRGETPGPHDVSDAKKLLNMMVKDWVGKGIHLWTKTKGYLFLQKGQSKYDLSENSSDHVADTYYKTTLSAAASISDTSLTVTSSANMTVGDYIGVEQDDGTLFWSTITLIPGATTVQINSGLQVAASSGNYVYNYTKKIWQPTRLVDANYRNTSDRDVPMNFLTYQEYFELPNKTSLGTPVNYSWDKQRDDIYFYIWLTPQNVDFLIPFVYERVLQDLDSFTDTPDFPTEWQECIYLNIASRIAGFFGKTGKRYDDLKQEAAVSLSEMLGYDNEAGSIYISPDDRFREEDE